jgi:hypothetical protein
MAKRFVPAKIFSIAAAALLLQGESKLILRAIEGNLFIQKVFKKTRINDQIFTMK